MFKVVRFFNDLQDKEHAYNAGDIYPREGMTPSESRINELSGDANAQGVPLIVEDVTVVDTPEETPEVKIKKGKQ